MATPLFDKMDKVLKPDNERTVVGFIGRPGGLSTAAVLASIAAARASNPSESPKIDIDYEKTYHNSKPTYIEIDSIPHASRVVDIDLKDQTIKESRTNWFELTYEDQKGLLHFIMRHELKQFNTRFMHDKHFYKFLKSSYYKILGDDETNTLMHKYNVKKTIFSIVTYNLLRHMLFDGTYAFSREMIIRAIDDFNLLSLSGQAMFNKAIEMVRRVDSRDFRLVDLPLTTELIDILSTDTDFHKNIEKNDAGIYINIREPSFEERECVFVVKFGKKHVALFEYIGNIHFSMWRLNKQPYKFKSLKKELGL